MSRLTRVIVHDCPVPTVEIDSRSGCVYVRLRRGKVARTVADQKPDGAVLTVDYDAEGRPLGVEFVGGRLFRITKILQRAKVELSNLRDVKFQVVA